MSDERLFFCMLTTFYPPHHFGGDAMYVYRLSNALARRGHRVTVVHCVDAYKTVGGRVRGDTFPHEPGVEVVRLESKLGAVSPTITYLFGVPGLKTKSLEQLTERTRFDVMHFHNISLVGGPGILSMPGDVKLYTTHEHWLVCPMHVLWKNNREPCVRPTCLRCTLAFRRPPQLWRYTRLLERQVRQVDLFLAPSRFVIEQHRQRGFDQPMRHLPYFIESVESARRETTPRFGARPYFLYVGRLEKIKGLHTLIEAFRTYDKADLLIAGEGTLGPELRRQAAGLDHVRFLGSADANELRPLYANAIALVVPSIGYDVFPFVSLEALSLGTPIIVRDLGGMPEAVEDSGGGFVYRTESELVEAMEKLRVDPGTRDRLGELGRQATEGLWSERWHLDTYLDVVDTLRTEPAGSDRVALALGGTA